MGWAGGVFFLGGGTGMNVVVKTNISYILERVFNYNNKMNAKLSI